MNEQVPSETFAIGEVAIICNAIYHPENNGAECVVVGGLDWWKVIDSNERCYSYKVEVNGQRFLCRPHQLRKKRPPREDLQVVRWNECPWKPQQVRA